MYLILPWLCFSMGMICLGYGLLEWCTYNTLSYYLFWLVMDVIWLSGVIANLHIQDPLLQSVTDAYCKLAVVYMVSGNLFYLVIAVTQTHGVCF